MRRRSTRPSKWKHKRNLRSLSAMSTDSRGSTIPLLSGNKVHVKGQPHFPCLGQNSFPFALMKTEQETSSGNRAQASLPELFYSQNRAQKPNRNQAGAIWEASREPFREQSCPPRGNLLRCLISAPIDILSMASRCRNIRASSPWKVASERVNHSLEPVQEQSQERRREQ